MINKYKKLIHNKFSRFFKFFFSIRYLFVIFFVAIVLFLLIPQFFDYKKTEFGGWKWGNSDPVHGYKREKFAKLINGETIKPAK